MTAEETPEPHKRRVRYKGKNPRHFEDKYKELNPERYADTVAHVLAGGKTPAGQHVPIMVGEIMQALSIQPGQRAVDCTLGYGGHAAELLKAVQPGGCLLGVDQDPIELPKTETRLRTAGFPAESLQCERTNFVALRAVLGKIGWNDGADAILADLGVSSMQIDNPARGFSFKHQGPLDMRMNPNKGVSASALIKKLDKQELATLLRENADEPNAEILATALAQQKFETTGELARAITQALPKHFDEDRIKQSQRLVFQALRIAVNDEFKVLDGWLRGLPNCLRSGGRVAVLTFHSGEDRRVKTAFKSGLADGLYNAISENVIRASHSEKYDNPRASSAKLRWAVRA
ncbi:MAG: 16S rRNA (cytosine(1402)-N(4))-methyltransferase RsmH [Akkermansiaceae bacterium]|jgi:16S rRNA (cytosine1402-N4)-methyltransferase|tara:strand:- start:962 stop:2002 length:1041 start_codon:yes stop_codon:yes gene_type:complete